MPDTGFYSDHTLTFGCSFCTLHFLVTRQTVSNYMYLQVNTKLKTFHQMELITKATVQVSFLTSVLSVIFDHYSKLRLQNITESYYCSAGVSGLGGHFPSLISFSFCFWIFPSLVYYVEEQ